MSTGRRAGGTAGVAGFTLIEMLVTLAVVGLAVTFAFQAAGGLGPGRRAARLSEAIAAEIGLLRAEAMRSGQATRLTYQPSPGWFLSSRPGAAPIATAPLPVSVQVAASERAVPGEIRFLPDGSSSGGRIVLGPDGARVVVSVGALTARVRRDSAP